MKSVLIHCPGAYLTSSRRRIIGEKLYLVCQEVTEALVSKHLGGFLAPVCVVSGLDVRVEVSLASSFLVGGQQPGPVL